MFRRRKDNDDGAPDAPDALEPAAGEASKVFPRAPATPSPRLAVGAATPMRPPVAPARGSDVEGKKLIVGREIVLSGTITSCDKLVVEGRVDANLSDSRSIEIAESGFFKGTAEIDSAEIAGRFEGTVTVRQRLFIRATGKVTGKIRYGMIEIEPGGEIAGDVQVATGADGARTGVPEAAPRGGTDLLNPQSPGG